MALNTHRYPTLLAAALFLFSLLAGCGPPVDNPVLPEPPALELDGFDTAVALKIGKMLETWQAAPLSPVTNGRLGMMLHAHGQSEWASVYYERARQLDREELSWVYLHALVLASLGERDQAVTALRQALILQGRYLPAKLKLAALLADTGHDDESLMHYEELLMDSPALPQALYGLGTLRLKQGDKSGIELLESAIRNGSSYGAAHYALAEAYRKVGDTSKAETQLELFRKHKDQEPPLADTLLNEMKDLNESKFGLINRGQRMLGEGRFREAAEQFELVLVKDPTAAGNHAVLISTYGILGQFDKAEAHYRQGIALDATLVRLHNNFGVLRLKQERYKEAAQAFRDAIAVDPDYIDAYVNLGAALESSKNRSAAIKTYRIAVERDPTHRQAGFYLGRALAAMSNPHRAAEQFLRILEPEDRMTPEYLRALAAAYLNMWKYDEAEAMLLRAIAVAKKTGREDLMPKLRTNLQRVQAAKSQSSNEKP